MNATNEEIKLHSEEQETDVTGNTEIFEETNEVTFETEASEMKTDNEENTFENLIMNEVSVQNEMTHSDSKVSNEDSCNQEKETESIIHGQEKKLHTDSNENKEMSEKKVHNIEYDDRQENKFHDLKMETEVK